MSHFIDCIIQLGTAAISAGKFVAARSSLACVSSPTSRHAENDTREGITGNNSVLCTKSSAWVANDVGASRKDTCVSLWYSLGGRFSHKYITKVEAAQVVKHGIQHGDHVVRLPLIHMVGFWEPSLCHTLTDIEREWYMLSCGPTHVDTLDAATVYSELEYFRYYVHHRFEGFSDVDRSYVSLGTIMSNAGDIGGLRGKQRVYTFDMCLPTLDSARRLAVILKRVGYRIGSLLTHLYPVGNQALHMRERIDVVDAWRCAASFLSIDVLALCLYCAKGLGGQTLARLLLYCCCGDMCIRFLKQLVAWNCFTGFVESTVARLKTVHNMIRNADFVPCADASSYVVDKCLYCHLLVGRLPLYSPIDAELKDRYQPRIESPLCEGVKSAGLQFLAQLLEMSTPRTVAKTERELVFAMIKDLANGNSSTALPDVLREAGLYTWSKAKMYLLSKVDHLCQQLYRPGCFGSAISKFEPGARNRVLMPSDDNDWLRWTALLTWIEGKLWRQVTATPLGWQDSEWADFSFAARIATSGRSVLAASDFDDYNQLHGNMLMSSIALTIGDHLSRASGSDMYRRIANLIADGIMQNQLTVEGCKHHMQYGLWSGWRSTTFINTLLNPIYNRIVDDAGSGWQASVFLGDDSVDVFTAIKPAVDHLALLDKNRFYAQHSKQMVSTRRMEFLRIMWRDGDAGTGSLIRAVSNGISSDLQGADNYVALTVDWVVELCGRLKRRLADLPAGFVRRLVGVITQKIQILHNRGDAYTKAVRKNQRVIHAAQQYVLTTPALIKQIVNDRIKDLELDTSVAAVSKELIANSFSFENVEAKYAVYNHSDVAVVGDEFPIDAKFSVKFSNPGDVVLKQLLQSTLGPLTNSRKAREALVSQPNLRELLFGNLTASAHYGFAAHALAHGGKRKISEYSFNEDRYVSL